MPKIKTHKATTKRFKITKGDKLIHRKAGQGHFNSRESGKTTRMKRKDIETTTKLDKTIRSLMSKNS